MRKRVEHYVEEHALGLAGWAILACLTALVYVWVPSATEKDSFRTWKLNEPPLGRWIYTAEELTAAQKEVFGMPDRIKSQIQAKTYTPQAYMDDLKRLTDLEYSLLPLDGGEVINRFMIPARQTFSGQQTTSQAVQTYRQLQLNISFTENEVVNLFHSQATVDMQREVRRLADARPATGIRPVLEDDWYWRPFWAWFIQTHFYSMGVVFLFFVLRAQFIGQRKKILVYDFGKTAFWMFFWPVGIWRYPSEDPVELVRIIQRRLAMAVSVFFSLAVPNFALAQGKSDGQKKKDNEHTLVIGVEAVDKYYGSVVGEVFAHEPAPRVLARYTRSTTKGQFYLDSWNSAGRAFNNEADLGGGFQRSGWDVSYTHFFVRGGDIEQLAVGKSFSIPVGGRKLSLGAGLLYYFGSNSASPPGGIVTKLGTGFSHKVGRVFSVQHKVSAGLDNNPFGLGRGQTLMGFYKGEIGFKKLYFSWNLSRPLVGRENTTRGFRHGIAAGWSHAFAW